MQPEAHYDDVRLLFAEYLTWANEQLGHHYGIDLGVGRMVDESMASLEQFSPPGGRILLALHQQETAGCACLKRLDIGVAELKRMYVRPRYRGFGIGRALMEAVVAEARKAQYQRIRLDSARFMNEAHSLYTSFGFQEIEPYAGSEIPPEFRQHWKFMEMDL